MGCVIWGRGASPEDSGVSPGSTAFSPRFAASLASFAARAASVSSSARAAGGGPHWLPHRTSDTPRTQRTAAAHLISNPIGRVPKRALSVLIRIMRTVRTGQSEKRMRILHIRSCAGLSFPKPSMDESCYQVDEARRCHLVEASPEPSGHMAATTFILFLSRRLLRGSWAQHGRGKLQQTMPSVIAWCLRAIILPVSGVAMRPRP